MVGGGVGGWVGGGWGVGGVGWGGGGGHGQHASPRRSPEHPPEAATCLPNFRTLKLRATKTAALAPKAAGVNAALLDVAEDCPTALADAQAQNVELQRQLAAMQVGRVGGTIGAYARPAAAPRPPAQPRHACSMACRR